MKLSSRIGLLGAALILNAKNTEAEENSSNRKLEQMKRESEASRALADERANFLALVSRDIFEDKKLEKDPECEIQEISDIRRTPSYFPNESENHPLQCVIGLNNAYYFTVESPSDSSCLSSLKAVIGESPFTPDDELCEWGYVIDPNDTLKWYIVASCDENADIKSSPAEGYEVLDWKNYKPGVIYPMESCLI